ncbi:MAG TPA: Rrf2 family transcriptional regulator [Vicinamibacterales bacterium]|nr:Rrf2 family transcriptional regulator [Vicinamibacterales bacterium]
MQLTRAADYGVRVMMHLAAGTNGPRASLTELADAADVSPAFLSKVLQRLVRAGLLASRRGKRGGFEMVERGRTASLYDVLEALDGVPALNVCLLDGGCHRSPWCAAHHVWMDIQDRMRESLRTTSLQSLALDTQSRKAALSGDNADAGTQGNGHGGGDGWFPVES